jgi:peptidyl-prolyl cis-trans isomerase C
MRNMPPGMLFPMIVNQVIDQKALLIAARKQGLQKDPSVQTIMQSAADTALQNVYLTREITPEVNDQAIRDVYDKTIANKPGEKEVHARHILVASEAQAKDVIKQLNGGADFAKLAATLSTDKASAAQNGGDLGWFKQGDMLPEFSAAAFAMKKGEISQTPVHTRYGWHVIQVLDTRTVPPPSFDSMKDQIRQKLIQQSVRAAVEKALTGVKVVRYKPDGSKVTAADQNASPENTAPGGSPPVPAQSAPATPGSTNAD